MKVILVEPSRTVTQIVVAMLERRGHEVTPFSDASAALEHLRADETVDVLITSGELGLRSGLELCWDARLVVGVRPLHILLMSSSDDRSLVAQALDCGADDFIRKPPFAEELYARLRVAERFASMQRELHRLATTDGLTGVLNRRSFFERARAMLSPESRDRALSAVMVDVDHFKSINDRFGHAAGDLVLVSVARVLQQGGALLGRLGGEEFGLIFSDCGQDEAIRRSEELRRNMECLTIPDGSLASGTLSVTASFGVAGRQGGQEIDHLLHCADLALYQAKQSGRNKTVAYVDASSGPAAARFRLKADRTK
ncbi:MAG TPA: diguanylate cyclase [Roseomonas sp.]|jgi:diguanylate cyclase (GGDEF)-like protein